MLTAVKKNKSLTFYQPTTVQQTQFSSSYTGGLSATAIASVGYASASTTTRFNAQLNGFLDMFSEQRAHDIATLNLMEPNQAARLRGVYRAWEYEKADIIMGGKGSENWTAEEQQSILEKVNFTSQSHSRAGVKNAEGDHLKNVAKHPEYQANPDNIKFYRSHEEHKIKGHNGNFKNETDDPLVNKDAMLRNTNRKRVFRNELKGVGMAAAIGAGVGFSIGFAVSLAQAGVTPDSVKYALAAGGKSGVASGVQSVLGYGIGRTVGQVAVKAMEGLLENVGLAITDNISKMCNMGIIGAITIAIFSSVQFIKLVHSGETLKNAAIQVGKQALFSLSLLVVEIAAQGIVGGSAGIIVAVSAGIICVTYSVADIVHQRRYSEKLRIYMIEKCKPNFG